MKKHVTRVEARRILSRVPLQISFWLCTNEHLMSLDDLTRALNRINDEVFRYHVNRDKNDFEYWIREVIKDRDLAREISRVKTKETLQRKIAERVKELKTVSKQAAKKKKAKKKPARRKARKGAGKRKAAKRTALRRRKKKAAKRKVRKKKSGRRQGRKKAGRRGSSRRRRKR